MKRKYKSQQTRYSTRSVTLIPFMIPTLNSSTTHSTVPSIHTTLHSTDSSMETIKLFFLLSSLSLLRLSQAQQPYIDNMQLDCYKDNNLNSTNGFVCNGPQTSCSSYITFRSQPPYDSALTIANFLQSEPSSIAKINNITNTKTIPTNTLIIVPVNCSCSGGLFYQHNASYTLKTESENYFTVANDTYQGLTTCQAMIKQNPVDSRKLYAGLKLLVPLRCACPSSNQSSNGVRFLLSYLVAWNDYVEAIAATFGVDTQSILDANEFSSPEDLIYPFTPLLVPLKTEPKKITFVTPPPPPPRPPTQPLQPEGHSSKNKKWVFTGIGIGVGLFLLAFVGLLICVIHRRRRNCNHQIPITDSADYTKAKNPGVISSKIVESLTLYEFEELQQATKNFREDHSIKGSVYRGVIRGDYAAIKRKGLSNLGDASSPTAREINLLKQMNHSNIVRLSGICMHEKQGNTYLVYEFAENGSLSDWLHDKKYDNRLGWKQRVQIAYDVADGLNYLHNYSNPPYIHKDLNSSAILLNGEFRAKMTNFGSATTVNNRSEEDMSSGLHLTRHVVGTRGYMPPEYVENGMVTDKLDVYAFGMIILELLSGKEAATLPTDGEEVSLPALIKQVIEGENVREKLKDFMDPALGSRYPLDSAFSMANMAMSCTAHDPNSRPTMSHVFMSLSKILSSSSDWCPSDELEFSGSLFSSGR